MTSHWSRLAATSLETAVGGSDQPPTPLPTPPIAADIVLTLLFAWAGWYLWRRGRGLRWVAVLLWVLALAGAFTVVAVLTTS